MTHAQGETFLQKPNGSNPKALMNRNAGPPPHSASHRNQTLLYKGELLLYKRADEQDGRAGDWPTQRENRPTGT
jgi:hypothetical protein